MFHWPTLFIVVPLLGLTAWGLARLGFFTGRTDLRLFAFITAVTAGTYFVWRRVGQFYDRRELKDEDGLYRSIYSKLKD